MKRIHARDLPDPINVRLPEPLLEELRDQALKNERTLFDDLTLMIVVRNPEAS